MTVKLVRVPETDYPEVDYKRVNAPYKLTGTCTCGEQIESDYTTTDYLSYPIVGQIRTLIAYCGECDTSHKMDVIFDIVLNPVQTTGTAVLSSEQRTLIKRVFDLIHALDPRITRMTYDAEVTIYIDQEPFGASEFLSDTPSKLWFELAETVFIDFPHFDYRNA